jgi:hypothetical protein
VRQTPVKIKQKAEWGWGKGEMESYSMGIEFQFLQNEKLQKWLVVITVQHYECN